VASLALLSEFGPKPAIHQRAVAREATSLYGERIRLWGQPSAVEDLAPAKWVPKTLIASSMARR
jgi:hypothetical protein